MTSANPTGIPTAGTALRMFLSSTRPSGRLAARLLDLLEGRTSTAIVANALDGLPVDDRAARVEGERRLLEHLGLRARELDLRDHFGDGSALAADLADVEVLWVRGGNVFVLRDAIARSGGDDLLPELLLRGTIVYGGYSAGSCVVGSTLRGLELADDPTLAGRTHGGEPMWDGLGLLDVAIVPHCDSPGHPKTALLDEAARRLDRDARPHVRLRDGQALLVRGNETCITE